MIKLKHSFTLASGSPRRSFLLKQIGLEFTVIKPDFDESFEEELPAMEVPLFLAELKSNQIPNKKENHIYLTSDTVVILDDKVIGKPTDLIDAKHILQKLSSQTHYVTTGVCIYLNNELIKFSETTKVTFNELSNEEINYYLNNFQPLDKAGSYGIQEWIGHACIEKIEGNFDNVVGLPTSRLYQELKKSNLLL